MGARTAAELVRMAEAIGVTSDSPEHRDIA
jgi:hypothetical protein